MRKRKAWEVRQKNGAVGIYLNRKKSKTVKNW